MSDCDVLMILEHQFQNTHNYRILTKQCNSEVLFDYMYVSVYCYDSSEYYHATGLIIC